MYFFFSPGHTQTKIYWQNNQQRNHNETVTIRNQNRIKKWRESACVGWTIILTTDSRTLIFLVNIHLCDIEVCEFWNNLCVFLFRSVLCCFRHNSSLLVWLCFIFRFAFIRFSFEAHFFLTLWCDVCVRLSFYFLYWRCVCVIEQKKKQKDNKPKIK